MANQINKLKLKLKLLLWAPTRSPCPLSFESLGIEWKPAFLSAENELKFKYQRDSRGLIWARSWLTPRTWRYLVSDNWTMYDVFTLLTRLLQYWRFQWMFCKSRWNNRQYGPCKSWKVLESGKENSRPGKSLKISWDPWKSLKILELVASCTTKNLGRFPFVRFDAVQGVRIHFSNHNSPTLHGFGQPEQENWAALIHPGPSWPEPVLRTRAFRLRTNWWLVALVRLDKWKATFANPLRFICILWVC